MNGSALQLLRCKCPKCTSPVLLFNRGVIRTMVQNGNYYVDGVKQDVPQKWLYDFPHHNFFPFKLGLYRKNNDDIFIDDTHEQRFYTCNEVTGECTPLFFLAPCGKCELCLYQKMKQFASRVVLEASCYTSTPIFVTLTYDDAHLPVDGVDIRHVQLFFKKLRHLLPPFRYSVVSEYGKKKLYLDGAGRHRLSSRRPHYHILLFGLDYFHIEDIIKPIQLSWTTDRRRCKSDELPGKTIHIRRSQGTITQTLLRNQRGYVDVQFLRKSSACGKYVSKYMAKPNNVPDGKNKNFRCSSKKNGGLGAPFLEKYDVVNYLRTHPRCHDFKYKTYDGKVQSFYPTLYTFNKIFPTYSRLVSSKFRSSLSGIQVLCNDLMNVDDTLRQPFLDAGIVDFGSYSRSRVTADMFNEVAISVCHLVDDYMKMLPGIPPDDYIDAIQNARQRYCAVRPVKVDYSILIDDARKALTLADEMDSY